MTGINSITSYQRIKPISDIMYDVIQAARKANQEAEAWTEEIAELNRTICRMQSEKIQTDKNLQDLEKISATRHQAMCELAQESSVRNAEIKRLQEKSDYYQRLAEERYQTIITDGCSATVGYHFRESEKTVEEQKNRIEDLVRCNESQMQSLTSLKTENLKLNAELLEEKKEHAYYKDLADTRRIRMSFFDKENEKLKEQINSLIKELNSKDVIISEQKELIEDLKRKSAAPFTNAQLVGYSNHYTSDSAGEWWTVPYSTKDIALMGHGNADELAVPLYRIP